VARGGASEQAAKTTFRDVFAVAEFRALWLAQLLSVAGDQLARVALTILVYDRTRSALLAAITFVVSIVPTFVGGITLAWLADRYPRRRVMIVCDLVRAILVLVMALPRVPIAAMVALLFVVTLTGAPFTSARAAVYPDVLTGDSYLMGPAVTLTTFQLAQEGRSSVCSVSGHRWSSTPRPSSRPRSSCGRGYGRAPRRSLRPARPPSRHGRPGSWPEPAWCSPTGPCAPPCSSAGSLRSTTLRKG
jgi:hypothetical protein